MHIFQSMGLLCGFNLPKATGGLQDARSVDTIVFSIKGNTDCEDLTMNHISLKPFSTLHLHIKPRA